jgi:restriction system protein
MQIGLKTSARPFLIGLAQTAVADNIGNQHSDEPAFHTWLPSSEELAVLHTLTHKNKLREKLLHSLCIRVAYLLATSDPGDHIRTIAVNAQQRWTDKATGQPRTGIIASLQSAKEALLGLHPGKFEPTACFRHFKGINTPSIDHVAPIRPIYILDKNDKRIVTDKDVAATLDQDTNLASMPWEDFEHLVRQFLEWEFGGQGMEVKVTQASRDRGVDAIMYDPDPIIGGKCSGEAIYANS